MSVVVFTASWSPASVLLARKLEAAAGGDVLVRCVDVDADVAAAESWRIIGLPTVVVCVGDVERRRLVGVEGARAVQVAGELGSRGARARARKGS